MLPKYSLVLIPLIAACSGSASSPQVLSGRIAPGFPVNVTTVRAMRGATILATSPIAADGTFQIAVPPSRNVTLQLVGASRSDVVFPRTNQTTQRGFQIRGGGVAFDLGVMHLASSTFVFVDGATAAACTDGEDANGATCIDDAGDPNDTCEAEDGGDTESSDDNGAEADASADEPDAGDATAEYNFPSDGCSGDATEGNGSN